MVDGLLSFGSSGRGSPPPSSMYNSPERMELGDLGVTYDDLRDNNTSVSGPPSVGLLLKDLAKFNNNLE